MDKRKYEAVKVASGKVHGSLVDAFIPSTLCGQKARLLGGFFYSETTLTIDCKKCLARISKDNSLEQL